MADEPARPRRLTVYAEAAAVLALVVAIVGVVVAVLALQHDKDVASGNSTATPAVTVTQYVRNTPGQDPDEAGSSSSGFWGVTGIVVLTILSGLVAGVFVFMSWENLVSDVGSFLATAVVVGGHAFVLSLLGLTVVWAVIVAVVFGAIGFLANVFAA
ncbi:hypothetical protein ACFFV7_33620 [Nonomuraea spiralis]|uniref:Uncharacterized protein n=1 Tax=Nonomuraea spiralis TaxID=46182 RepID=A0ABV5IQY5_9ACTN|nr:hypothetical protein [Nonomuraea spiralis]GGT33057.1 hypothetical protein GCM10010176_092040 [Nonomuraea spiralis]